MADAMVPPELEKIDTSIVVLSAVQKEVKLSSQEIASVIKDPQAAVVGQGIGQPPAQVQITSLRDQVIVTIMGGKFLFEDKSDVLPGTHRLPEIVDGFLNLLRKQGVDRFRAYGINFTVEFDSRGDQAVSEIIAERYLNRKALSEKGQIAVLGAGIRLFFQHVDAMCDMKIEPRKGKVDSPRFFAHINYNFDLPDETMPPLQDLMTKYLGLWPQFTQLLDTLVVRS